MRDDQRKVEGLGSDDGDDGDGLSFLLGLVFFSMVMMMVIISLPSVWGLGSIFKPRAAVQGEQKAAQSGGRRVVGWLTASWNVGTKQKTKQSFFLFLFSLSRRFAAAETERHRTTPKGQTEKEKR